MQGADTGGHRMEAMRHVSTPALPSDEHLASSSSLSHHRRSAGSHSRLSVRQQDRPPLSYHQGIDQAELSPRRQAAATNLDPQTMNSDALLPRVGRPTVAEAATTRTLHRRPRADGSPPLIVVETDTTRIAESPKHGHQGSHTRKNTPLPEKSTVSTGTLTCRSEITASPSARQLMRQVSGLGMEDPVFGTPPPPSSQSSTQGDEQQFFHPSLIFDDMSIGDIPQDMRDLISVASDPTATHDEGIDTFVYQQSLSDADADYHHKFDMEITVAVHNGTTAESSHHRPLQAVLDDIHDQDITTKQIDAIVTNHSNDNFNNNNNNNNSVSSSTAKNTTTQSQTSSTAPSSSFTPSILKSPIHKKRSGGSSYGEVNNNCSKSFGSLPQFSTGNLSSWDGYSPRKTEHTLSPLAIICEEFQQKSSLGKGYQRESSRSDHSPSPRREILFSSSGFDQQEVAELSGLGKPIDGYCSSPVRSRERLTPGKKLTNTDVDGSSNLAKQGTADRSKHPREIEFSYSDQSSTTEVNHGTTLPPAPLATLSSPTNDIRLPRTYDVRSNVPPPPAPPFQSSASPWSIKSSNKEISFTPAINSTKSTRRTLPPSVNFCTSTSSSSTSTKDNANNPSDCKGDLCGEDPAVASAAHRIMPALGSIFPDQSSANARGSDDGIVIKKSETRRTPLCLSPKRMMGVGLFSKRLLFPKKNSTKSSSSLR